MGYTIYEIMWMFFIYSFLGWCTEEVYATWAYKKFANRGFFNGALCPIYGVGIIIVVSCLEPLRNNYLYLFIGSVLLTSLLELVTGFVLEKIFNEKWWDYTDNKFNLHGYICLSFSIMWGAACSLVVLIVHPLVVKFIRAINYNLGCVLLGIILGIFILDLIVTVTSICKFKRKLKLMDDLARRIKSVSDEIGINIYDGVSSAISKEESFKENAIDIKEKMVQAKEISLEKFSQAKEISIEKMAQAKEMSLEKLQQAKTSLKPSDTKKVKANKRLAELEEIKTKYKKVFDKNTFSYLRIVDAFPVLKNGKYKEYISKMKKIYKKQD